MATNHPSEKIEPAKITSQAEMEASFKDISSVIFKKVKVADWQIDLSGLLNLKHEKALAAGLKDKMADIQIYMYIITHPEFGTVIVDSGVEDALARGLESTNVSKMIQKFMNMDALKVQASTKTILSEMKLKPKALFLTHLHMDHVFGVADFPKGIDVFVGPTEATSKAALNVATVSSITKMFKGHKAIKEIDFTNTKERGIWDYFGDGSFYVIASPGHTLGSLAFIVRSESGLHLITGDTSHTQWGWDNNVTPGTFSVNHNLNAASLDYLIKLSKKFPEMRVHNGHQ